MMGIWTSWHWMQRINAFSLFSVDYKYNSINILKIYSRRKMTSDPHAILLWESSPKYFSDVLSIRSDDEDESYLDTVLNFNHQKYTSVENDYTLEYKLREILLDDDEGRVRHRKVQRDFNLFPVSIPLECMVDRLHDPRLDLAPEVQELDADGTVSSTTSNLAPSCQQVNRNETASENASPQQSNDAIDRNIQDVINKAVATFRLKSHAVLPKSFKVEFEPSSPVQSISCATFDNIKPSESPANDLPEFFESNFSINPSIMDEINKISSALSIGGYDQNQDVERQSPNADLVTSTHDGFDYHAGCKPEKPSDGEAGSSMNFCSAEGCSEHDANPCSQTSIGFYVPCVESSNSKASGSGVSAAGVVTDDYINETVHDMIKRFSDKTKDVLRKAGLSHEFVQDFDRSLKHFETVKSDDGPHLRAVSQYVQPLSSCSNQFEKVISAATDHFLSELNKRKRENFFYVFNGENSICLTLKKHLEFFLEKKQLHLQLYQHDFNFAHDVCVYLHKDDIQYVRALPGLYWFKNIPFSTFYVFDDIKKVDASHECLQKLFPESGVIVPSTPYFTEISSHCLDLLLKEMVNRKAMAKDHCWNLLLHSDILLNLSSNSKMGNDQERGDILKTLISYSKHNIWQVMSSHMCDNPGAAFSDQLKCAIDVQDSRINTHRHVIILSDRCPDITELHSCGIGMMNIEEMIQFLRRT